MKLSLLLLKRQSIILFLLLAAIILFLSIGFWSLDAYRNPLLGAFIGVGIVILEQVIEVIILYKKYKNFEGKYKGHEYVSNDPKDIKDSKWDELKKEECSRAELIYQGGNEFKLILSNPAEGNITHTWEGVFRMTSENMADIGYKYSKWPNNAHLEHSAGHKRAVVFQDKNDSRIYMFSNDGQRFGREVLIRTG